MCCFLFTVISCKQIENNFPYESQKLVFEMPQPVNDGALQKIPTKFLGRFINSDSTVLIISNKYILAEYSFKQKLSTKHLDSLKTKFTFKNAKLISKKNDSLIYNYRILKDSIELTEKQFDTVFKFSKNKIAKRIDGQLILSERDSVFWHVKLFSVTKDYLKINHLSYQRDLYRIDSITKIKSKNSDSIHYILRPSRREFKKIINLPKLGYPSIYKKML